MKIIHSIARSGRTGLINVILLMALPWGVQAQSGQVGIGTNTPSEKLDVDGNIKISGEIMPNGASGNLGQLLKSNGDGSMGWTDNNALSGSVGYGTWGNCEISGITEYYPVSDPEGEEYDYIGCSVAISGDFAVIGAKLDDGNVGENEGLVTVLIRDWNTGLWVLDGTNQLRNSGTAADDRFGNSVSIDGYYMVAGAYMDDETYADQGTVSIYKRNASNDTWELQGSKFTNPSPASDEYFGHSVDISGNYVICGTPFDDYVGGADHGSAVIFERDTTSGVWSIDGGKIIDPDNSPGDRFGHSVSISGYYAIIGAPSDGGPAGSNQGSVCIYKKDTVSGNWNLNGSKIYSPSPGGGYQFGYSVAMDGDFAIVGAPFDGSSGVASAGAAYVFKRNPNTDIWEPFGDRLLNPDIDVNEDFGTTVAISDHCALVGCYAENAYKGSVTLFVNVGSAFQAMEWITDPWGVNGDSFGYSIGIESSTRRFVLSAIGAFTYTGKVVFGKY